MIYFFNDYSFKSLLHVFMLLSPRKFKFKNSFKRRSYYKIPRNNPLTYTDQGLQITQPLRLNNKHIFRIKLFLKKSARRADKTSRKVWFNLFPHLPLSKKGAGSRMGKGTGKLAAWVVELPSGLNIFEFKNLRHGRAVYFMKQVQSKLPVKSRINRSSNLKKINNPLKPSSRIFVTYFW